MPSISAAPNGGAKPFGSFSAFGKGTRRKGETIGRRYRSNGYVRDQKKTLALALAFDLDLPAPFPEAERRHCAVGIPAWMPG
jgi:hypothetical protein